MNAINPISKSEFLESLTAISLADVLKHLDVEFPSAPEVIALPDRSAEPLPQSPRDLDDENDAPPGPDSYVVTFPVHTEIPEDATSIPEIAESDPVVLTWALMGIAELFGMRSILWQENAEIPEDELRALEAIITRALGTP